MLCVAINSYPALLNAYADVGRRIAAAIAGQAHKSAKLTAPPSPIAAPTSPGALVQVLVAPQADVQVDHHLLAAAIQTQVEGLFGMEKHSIDVLQVRLYGSSSSVIDLLGCHSKEGHRPRSASCHKLHCRIWDHYAA